MKTKTFLLVAFLLIAINLYNQEKKRIVLLSDPDTVTLVHTYIAKSFRFISPKYDRPYYDTIMYQSLNHYPNMDSYVRNKFDSLFRSQNYEVVNFMSNKYFHNTFYYLTMKKPLKKTKAIFDVVRDSLKADFLVRLKGGGQIYTDEERNEYSVSYFADLYDVNTYEQLVFQGGYSNVHTVDTIQKTYNYFLTGIESTDARLSNEKVNLIYESMLKESGKCIDGFVKKWDYWKKYNKRYIHE